MGVSRVRPVRFACGFAAALGLPNTLMELKEVRGGAAEVMSGLLVVVGSNFEVGGGEGGEAFWRQGLGGACGWRRQQHQHQHQQAAASASSSNSISKQQQQHQQAAAAAAAAASRPAPCARLDSHWSTDREKFRGMR